MVIAGVHNVPPVARHVPVGAASVKAKQGQDEWVKSDLFPALENRGDDVLVKWEIVYQKTGPPDMNELGEGSRLPEQRGESPVLGTQWSESPAALGTRKSSTAMLHVTLTSMSCLGSVFVSAVKLWLEQLDLLLSLQEGSELKTIMDECESESVAHDRKIYECPCIPMRITCKSDFGVVYWMKLMRTFKFLNATLVLLICKSDLGVIDWQRLMRMFKLLNATLDRARVVFICIMKLVLVSIKVLCICAIYVMDVLDPDDDRGSKSAIVCL